MIEVTEAAQKAVQEYFDGKTVQPIRIFVNQGCGGPQLAMALDEKKADDASFEAGGILYVMESSLLESASPVKIDFSGMGFQLSSSLELGSGCSSCGTKGSCCS